MLPTNLPDTTPTFTTQLPIPVTGETPVSELTFSFEKVHERGYEVSGDTMWAGLYTTDTDLGVAAFAVVVNAESGQMNNVMALVARAAGVYFAFIRSHQEQDPPLPVPPNRGVQTPLSWAAVTNQDGTERLRGMAGGVHSLEAEVEKVNSVDVFVPPAWT